MIALFEMKGYDPYKDYTSSINIDKSRDSKLSEFGKILLKNRYIYKGESFQELFARVAGAYGDSAEHSQRLYDYMSNLWFMPATPILSNAGTKRGLPISCFINEVDDSLKGILELWSENVWLAAKGGGIGSYWGNVRAIGENIGENGSTSGIVPFMHVMDSMTLAISQGSLRRGSAAVYLPIDHPEIEEFIGIRRPTGGDANRKCMNLHHGVAITDDFMRAVRDGKEWCLKARKTGSVVSRVDARGLWIRLLTARIETGEPYIIYIDNVNKRIPSFQADAGLRVKTSNLCSEIMLPTGVDHFGRERTAVCCLSSLNLVKYDEWIGDKDFIPNVMRFLDNVLSDFCSSATSEIENARYSAMRERSVGLGVMGYHSFLQAKGVPFDCAISTAWTHKIFRHIKKSVDEISRELARERGPCPDAHDYDCAERFSCKTAIAPTASISGICGGASPCIEPWIANVYTHKSLSGNITLHNPILRKLLEGKDCDIDKIWNDILLDNGSVQGLDILDEEEKAVFKTAFEIHPRWVIELAAARTPYIDQSTSVNVFLAPDIDKKMLHEIHYNAWEKGVKSLYYCRSFAGSRVAAQDKVYTDEECLSCQ